MKNGALHHRVHLNNLKVYLSRPTKAEKDVKIVDILEYERQGTGDRLSPE